MLKALDVILILSMANIFREFLSDAEKGDSDSIQKAIHRGIDLETRDEDQQTALILAARLGHIECVKVLVDTKANVNAEDVDGWTALLNATKEGYIDIVRLLVENNADIEHSDCGGFTSLMWAAYQGHTAIVEYLITSGSVLNVVDEHGITPLTWASGRGHVAIVSALLSAGAKPNLADKTNTTALHWACRRNYTNIAQLLLQHGANINAIGMKNVTPLLVCLKNGHQETALRLLECRPDIKVQDKDGQTALSLASSHGMTDVVKVLIEQHAYVNTTDKNGDSVLFSAVKSGNEDCVAILIDSHADIDIVGAENKTVVWWAVERGKLEILKYLLQFNPDVEICAGEEEDTPLLLATKRKRVAMVYELIKYGAKLSAVDRHGDNCLHIALRNRTREIADILLSNPRHSKYLYRPNKKGVTPYKIDATLQKSILTTIFGQRTLNLNDDSILGYDLYSSALAEILSEPSLRTPITVGLFAKWGSGKSFLLSHLKDEMKGFAQLTDFPTLKFSPLLISLVLIIALIIGLLTGFMIHYIVGLVLSFSWLLLSFLSLFLIYYLLKRKDYLWTANIAHFITNRLESLRFLLQVLFMNPHGIGRKQGTDDYKKMKFIFTEYGKVSTVEDGIGGMIASLSQNVEDTFGLISTRLCRVLQTKDESRYRFRYICCMPAFVFGIIIFVLLFVMAILAAIKGVPSTQRSVNITYITLISLVSAAFLSTCHTWIRLIFVLIKAPKSKIIRFNEKNDLVGREGSMYRLKKEITQLSYIIKSVDAFLNITTRLVVLIDGLDVCEQSRILQILDQVHVLFTRENHPFITLLVVDPHMKIVESIPAVSGDSSQHALYDTNVNGHDYLRSIIQLPVYLQLNLTKTKQLKKNADTGYLKKRGNVSTSELTHQLMQSDYFLDINPRILQRLINIIAMTGRLLRAYQVLFSWKRLGSWIYLTEQWPYRISWIVVCYEDHEQNFSNDESLKVLYEKIQPFIPQANDPLLELDRNPRKFELFLECSEPVLTMTDLKLFLPCTCNLDPYLSKLIRGALIELSIDCFNKSPSYWYATNPHSQTANTDIFKNFNEANIPLRTTTQQHQRSGVAKRRGSVSVPFNPKFGCPSPSNDSNRFYQAQNTSHTMNDQAYFSKNRYNRSHMRLYEDPNVSSSTSSVPHQQANVTELSTTDGTVKLDMTPMLSQMSVSDICDSIKTNIDGLKPSMIPIYVQDMEENNISGQVLTSCDLDDLRQAISMTFGDWVLFTNWVRIKRDHERRSQFRVQQHQQQVNINDNKSIINDSYDDYDLYAEKNVLSAALSRLLSPSSTIPANGGTNLLDENDVLISTRPSSSDYVVTDKKNVKFFIPLSRSGVTSNEDTIGVIESTSRRIAHVKDLFSYNNTLQPSITISKIGTENHRQRDERQIDEEPLLRESNVDEHHEQNENVGETDDAEDDS
ncbi:unnamed protein product [Didymodactylos carnosus]|uniref:KAP NTPase domain-containing protein n=1 Tax=Didymodactylos carnosus TaxID=1234261 RepID=A0A814RHG0_9BILA|nr:unnamed protein product [Didymodactylos carnosus]CAF3896126.1 unnamed protein product [Didymodactylos carnosus]